MQGWSRGDGKRKDLYDLKKLWKSKSHATMRKREKDVPLRKTRISLTHQKGKLGERGATKKYILSISAKGGMDRSESFASPVSLRLREQRNRRGRGRKYLRRSLPSSSSRDDIKKRSGPSTPTSIGGLRCVLL